jgi:hypothetical protein
MLYMTVLAHPRPVVSVVLGLGVLASWAVAYNGTRRR